MRSPPPPPPPPPLPPSRYDMWFSNITGILQKSSVKPFLNFLSPPKTEKQFKFESIPKGSINIIIGLTGF